MALYCKVGEVTQVLAGDVFVELCFEPKALFVWTTEGDGGYDVSFTRISLGWCSSTTDQRSRTLVANSPTSVFGGGAFSGNLASGMGGSCTLLSFDADGFTLDFDNDNSHIYYMALGGDDLEVATGTFHIDDGDTSDVVVTSAGFTPDLILFNHAWVQASHGFGMATASDQCACFHLQTFGGIGASAFKGQTFSDIDVVNTFNPTFGNPTVASAEYRCQLASMDANGFTLTVPIANGGTLYDLDCDWIALKSPSTDFAVGYDSQKTSTGTQATTGVGFQPGAGVFAGSLETAAYGQTGYDPSGGPISISVGFSDSDGNSSVYEESAGTLGNYQASRGEAGLVRSSSNSDGSTFAEAALSSFDSDGFTLDWLVADSDARKFMYALFETETGPLCPDFIPQIYRRL